jgi:hypothetical protein
MAPLVRADATRGHRSLVRLDMGEGLLVVFYRLGPAQDIDHHELAVVLWF